MKKDVSDQTESRSAEPEINPSPLLAPGRNCWRLERSERTAFLIDGETYFQAFRDVAVQAKNTPS